MRFQLVRIWILFLVQRAKYSYAGVNFSTAQYSIYKEKCSLNKAAVCVMQIIQHRRKLANFKENILTFIKTVSLRHLTHKQRCQLQPKRQTATKNVGKNRTRAWTRVRCVTDRLCYACKPHTHTTSKFWRCHYTTPQVFSSCSLLERDDNSVLRVVNIYQ